MSFILLMSSPFVMVYLESVERSAEEIFHKYCRDKLVYSQGKRLSSSDSLARDLS
jgi:hypothetical protein